MKRRSITALFSAVTVLLVAGAVHSDAPVKGNVTLMDFESATETLLGYPDGTPPLGWFVRTENTQYVPGLIPKYPPNPSQPLANSCRGLTRSWNRILMRTADSTERGFALTNILGRMAQAQCRANIVRDANSDPQTIYSIEPTP
jgi:hypothetical protein